MGNLAVTSVTLLSVRVYSADLDDQAGVSSCLLALGVSLYTHTQGCVTFPDGEEPFFSQGYMSNFAGLLELPNKCSRSQIVGLH